MPKRTKKIVKKLMPPKRIKKIVKKRVMVKRKTQKPRPKPERSGG